MKINVNKYMWWTRHVHERLALCVSLITHAEARGTIAAGQLVN